MEQSGRKSGALPRFGVALLVMLGGWLLLVLVLALLISFGVLPWRFARVALCAVWMVAAVLGSLCFCGMEGKGYWLRLAVLLLTAFSAAWLMGQFILGGASLDDGGLHFLLSMAAGAGLAVVLRMSGGKKRHKFSRRKR